MVRTRSFVWSTTAVAGHSSSVTKHASSSAFAQWQLSQIMGDWTTNMDTRTSMERLTRSRDGTARMASQRTHCAQNQTGVSTHSEGKKLSQPGTRNMLP